MRRSQATISINQNKKSMCISKIIIIITIHTLTTNQYEKLTKRKNREIDFVKHLSEGQRSFTFNRVGSLIQKGIGEQMFTNRTKHMMDEKSTHQSRGGLQGLACQWLTY